MNHSQHTASPSSTFTLGQKIQFEPGQKVICNGYPGAVVRMYSEGMVEVRLPGGVVCVSASYPDCYPYVPALRESLADDVFSAYLFGDDVTVETHNSWNTDDPNDWTKIVYVTYADNDPQADSSKISFHVRFAPDGKIEDAYGLDMARGNDIGRRGDVHTLTSDSSLSQ